MALTINIMDGIGLSNKAHHECLPKETMVMFHKRKLFNACTSAGICSAFVANVSSCIRSEGLKRWLHSSFVVTALA